MSPFKEPQPRKPSVEKDAEKVIGGQWPPYRRLGDEARWDGRSEKAHADIAEARSLEVPNTPEAVEFQEAINEALQGFELRKAALEAACALQGNQPNTTFWDNIEAAENYLRDGTKPS